MAGQCKCKRSRKRPISEINVVPYIDVMLVMLVVFMITAHSPELVLARPGLGIQYHLGSGMEAVLLTLQQVPAE